jgi:nucleotide-binding universal stress UspA family protein
MARPMAIKDILLTLTSYPEPTPASVLEDAVSIAATLGAHLAAVSCEVHVQVPGHFLAGSIANIPGIIAGEDEKSRKSAKNSLAAFDAAAAKAGVLHETFVEKCPTFRVPNLLVDYARLRDLTIVPVPASHDQWYAEAVIFGSGRPTLVLPETPRSRPFELGTIVVAWDFSRAAARAVSDAIPLLERARKVRVVTVTNEKNLDTKHSAEELAKNLARHGIDVVLDKVDANGRRMGEVLEAYALSHQADVLVMGAYGHARWREFILGGATKSLLSKPLLPILLSH